MTPVVANGTLYYCTPFMRVFALDPETGAERWSFDPRLRGRGVGGPYPLTCRGVAWWEEPRPREGEACQRRIFYGTRDSELIALDADSGEPCAGFGARRTRRPARGPGRAARMGVLPDLAPAGAGRHRGAGRSGGRPAARGRPFGCGAGLRRANGQSGMGLGPGAAGPPLRSARGGALRARHAHVWAPLSGDAELGLVFVPTGNASPDSFGGMRGGLDHYGSSVVALSAATGRVVWSFQTVHHDIWDYDVPAQPQLFQHPEVGGGRPALVQPTKMGHVFVLDRATGEPLYPVEERPVPQDPVPGETLSPTQPFPTHPPPLHPQEFAPEDAFGFTPWDRASCREQVEAARYDGIFTPPTLGGSIPVPPPAAG